MRICHVVNSLDPDCGGPPAVVMNLAVAQARLGHDVVVIGYCPREKQSLVQGTWENLRGVAPVRLVFITNGGRFDHLFALRACVAFGQLGVTYDVLHIHGAWRPALIWALARCRARCRVVTPHGMYTGYALAQKPVRKQLALALYWRRATRRADLLQALSELEARDLQREFPGPRVVTVPNGVDPKLFLGNTDGEFRRQYPILRGRPYALFLARLDRIKGVDLLVDAFGRIATQLPDACLVIAGPDYGMETLVRKQITDLGLQDRAFLVGPIYAGLKLSALAGAVCLCQPSRYDTFPLSVVEALASAVPVVVSTNSGFSDALADAGAGQLVNLTVEQIAVAMHGYFQDPAARALAGVLARKYVQERYSWDPIAAELLACYAQLLAGPR